VGESGSGKSATALSILKLLDIPPAEINGEVIFKGRDLLKMPEKKLRKIRGKEISFIFQDPQSSLNPVLRVGDQIVEQIMLHMQIGKKEAKEIAIKLFEDVGIPNARKRINDYPHQFSGGMKQRVMIAMAISCRPKIIIADEPTSALDVTIQAQILDILRNLKQKGISIIFITHDFGIVENIADRIVVMYAGRIVERGKKAEIFKDARHPYTKGLLECFSSFSKGEDLAFIPGVIPSLIDLPKGCAFHPRCKYKLDECTEHVPREFFISQTHAFSCHLK
jgi:oligopeptide/dipeptide ABC transporter ATP-binding protein